MRYRKLLVLVAVLVSCYASAFAHHVAVITQKENSLQNLSSVELGKIFKSDMKKWPNGRDIVIVLNANSPDSMEMLQHFTRLSSDKGKAFLAEHKSLFVIVDSDDQVLDMVSARPGSLGMVDVRAIDSRIKVLKIDGKLPLEKGYLPD
jgi:ABC-type phosphate transport system substrate-binding protein